MKSPYKGRRPSIVKNFWIYRKLVALAMVLGMMLWFVWANNAPVTVAFPFGLGNFSSSLGLIILLSALVGAVVSALTLTLIHTLKRRRNPGQQPTWEGTRANDRSADLNEERPPSDYAAKTSDGFSDSHWS
ncbi:lipopolysaccharide assembly protein LapA domain-containing protein [Singulisphaera sp. PoT]|uniref:lipopolysaccharide assembly protein LapA domain-containing protein n=1 Tax=Singulisphaera sp. PoT TaxID=3411797 RepID=UPI003BF558EE